jgi:hypothetical protein
LWVQAVLVRIVNTLSSVRLFQKFVLSVIITIAKIRLSEIKFYRKSD